MENSQLMFINFLKQSIKSSTIEAKTKKFELVFQTFRHKDKIKLQLVRQLKMYLTPSFSRKQLWLIHFLNYMPVKSK